MSDSKVRVRMAPSPTGFVHLGNTYSAYFDYLFAQQQGGTFIVRLDDTDRERHNEEAVGFLVDIWHWLGIKWQEGFDVGGPYGTYRQSLRIERYNEVISTLINEDKAYQKDGAIYLRIPEGGPIVVHDLVRGEVTFDRNLIEDYVIRKSDGYPTYQFATVVDEIDHRITHVVRGEDHLSNTPRQLMVFEALGMQPPMYAHLPLLRNPDKSKLSKRQGHASTGWYRMKGYLPQALKNYFFLLGLGNPEQKDVYSEEEMVRLFSFERFNKTGPVFDLDKLTWLNGLYIRSMTPSELLNLLIAERFVPDSFQGDLVYLERVVALAQERLKILSEFWDDNSFFFEDIDVAPELIASYIGDENLRRKFIDEVHFNLTKLETWNIDEIESTLRRVQNDFSLKPKDAFMTIRIAVSAQEHTPPLFDMVELLGKEVVLKRLNVHI